MENNQSLARSKKSMSSLADILLKDSVNTLVPGAALMYDVGKLAVQHAKQYFSDRTGQRVNDFHMGLVRGETESQESIDKLMSKPFSLDEYHAVLNACVQDIENEKTEVYSQLMKSLITDEITGDYRRFFITVTKTLNASEIDFLRTLYINANHDMMTVGGTHQQVTSILKGKNLDAMTKITVNTLVSYGLITEERDDITRIGRLYAETLFVKSELTPVSIGRKEFKNIKVAILNYKIGDSIHDSVAEHLGNALWEKGIKSSILTLSKSSHQAKIMFNVGVLLLSDMDYDPKHFDRIAIADFASSVPVIQLNITRNQVNTEDLKLKSPSIDLTSEDLTHIRDSIYKIVADLVD